MSLSPRAGMTCPSRRCLHADDAPGGVAVEMNVRRVTGDERQRHR